MDRDIDRSSDRAQCIAGEFKSFLSRRVEARIGWECRLSESDVTVTAPDGHLGKCNPSAFSEDLLEQQLREFSVRRTGRMMR